MKRLELQIYMHMIFIIMQYRACVCQCIIFGILISLIIRMKMKLLFNVINLMTFAVDVIDIHINTLN